MGRLKESKERRNAAKNNSEVKHPFDVWSQLCHQLCCQLWNECIPDTQTHKHFNDHLQGEPLH